MHGLTLETPPSKQLSYFRLWLAKFRARDLMQLATCLLTAAWTVYPTYRAILNFLYFLSLIL